MRVLCIIFLFALFILSCKTGPDIITEKGDAVTVLEKRISDGKYFIKLKGNREALVRYQISLALNGQNPRLIMPSGLQFRNAIFIKKDQQITLQGFCLPNATGVVITIEELKQQQ